jgi:hypothetical protein
MIFGLDQYQILCLFALAGLWGTAAAALSLPLTQSEAGK